VKIDPKIASEKGGHDIGVALNVYLPSTFVYMHSTFEARRAAADVLESAVLSEKPLVESMKFEQQIKMKSAALGFNGVWRSGGKRGWVPKLLKSWSGRPGSNRRRPAWENDRRLKTQDNGVYGGKSRCKGISNFQNSASKSPLK
jgi:hypothetical protein